MEKGGLFHVIIHRPYSYLEDEIRRVFAGREDVRIIIDRRYEERRRQDVPIMINRRAADRRRSVDELIKIIIEPEN